MTSDEFASWLPRARDEYAAEIAASGEGSDQETAHREAREHSEQLFPGGRPSPEQFVFVVESDGKRVGELWLSERATGLGRCLWIYNIRIDEAHRGRGYGRAAMLHAEAEARQRGYNRIGLSVSGRNEIARDLYLSLGYEENSIFMSKPV
jgi:ribosomal protein S18 acetylase RimI-like enzyme